MMLKKEKKLELLKNLQGHRNIPGKKKTFRMKKWEWRCKKIESKQFSHGKDPKHHAYFTDNETEVKKVS